MVNKSIKLVDVGKPELFRQMFPYAEFPAVVFDGEKVEYEIPENIWITDTTFRDGQQARPPYKPEQILRIYDLLHEIDGGTGLIRQCEFFLYSERDREAVELCKQRGYKFPEITGWIRAVPADFKLVTQMGLAETGILTSASDYHIFLKLKKTRAQAMNAYLDIARAALDSGVIPRCHFEDITRADYKGFVLPFAAELMKLSKEYDKPVKIRLCDTLGFGVPWAGVALPRSIPKLINGLRRIGVPSEWLEWHGHNDFHKVEVDAATACPVEGNGRRCQLRRHHRTGRVRCKGTTPGDPKELPFGGKGFQCHSSGHPRRRPAEERGNLQLFRHAEAAWPSHRRCHHRQDRSGGHQTLDRGPVRGNNPQARSAHRESEGQNRRRICRRQGVSHFGRGNVRVGARSFRQRLATRKIKYQKVNSRISETPSAMLSGIARKAAPQFFILIFEF